ncbi:hypothetical protein J6Q66_01560 [bacterium]|nr:hypothetical protein [bacterium]
MLNINPITFNSNTRAMFKGSQKQEKTNIELNEIPAVDCLDEYIPSVLNQRNTTNVNDNSLKGFLDNLLKSIQKMI